MSAEDDQEFGRTHFTSAAEGTSTTRRGHSKAQPDPNARLSVRAQHHRSWREIAQDVLREPRRDRVDSLLLELLEAIEEQILFDDRRVDQREVDRHEFPDVSARRIH